MTQEIAKLVSFVHTQCFDFLEYVEVEILNKTMAQQKHTKNLNFLVWSAITPIILHKVHAYKKKAFNVIWK